MSKPSNWYKWGRGTTTERGYGHAWRKIRAVRLKIDNGLCVMCKQQNKVEQATEVDHIIEKAAGGTDDIDNLQSLCNVCHMNKTIGKQSAACDANGLPIDKTHHWFN